MMISKRSLAQLEIAGRHMLLFVVALVFVTGCGKPVAHVAIPFSPPEEFSDGGGTWLLEEGEPSQSDNQKIGGFFQQHPDLVGSPEWTGQPVKYIVQGASRKRFYWFSGNSENPSWNALEVDGGRSKQMSGVGSPATEEME